MTTSEYYFDRLLQRLRNGEAPADAYAETYFQVYDEQRIIEVERSDLLKSLFEVLQEHTEYPSLFDDSTAKTNVNDEVSTEKEQPSSDTEAMSKRRRRSGLRLNDCSDPNTRSLV